MKTRQREAFSIEGEALLRSMRTSRLHAALQPALTTGNYLSGLVEAYESAGVPIQAAVQFECANVLWDQGEATSSIRMLQDLRGKLKTFNSEFYVGKAELLAKLVCDIG